MTLVNVSQDYVSNGMTYVPENFLEDILNEMEKASLEQLHQAKSKLKSAGINPETVHLKGDPGYEILNYARETEQQQLIIIGSRGLRGVKGMMLGSVSHKVISFATTYVQNTGFVNKYNKNKTGTRFPQIFGLVPSPLFIHIVYGFLHLFIC
ncbi:universal stress protein [Paenibacillus sp. FSL R5-0407]|uniref:universal stress protein n=1 Tax=Paenibacillus sp. FSL R5-0407 TaxID=2975320 RepID=UPI0030FCDABF